MEQSTIIDLKTQEPLSSEHRETLWNRIKSYLQLVKTKRGAAVISGILIILTLSILWLRGVFNDEKLTPSDKPTNNEQSLAPSNTLPIQGTDLSSPLITGKPNAVARFIVDYHRYLLGALVGLILLVAVSFTLSYLKTRQSALSVIDYDGPDPGGDSENPPNGQEKEGKRTLIYGIGFGIVGLLLVVAAVMAVLWRRRSTSQSGSQTAHVSTVESPISSDAAVYWDVQQMTESEFDAQRLNEEGEGQKEREGKRLDEGQLLAGKNRQEQEAKRQGQLRLQQEEGEAKRKAEEEERGKKQELDRRRNFKLPQLSVSLGKQLQAYTGSMSSAFFTTAFKAFEASEESKMIPKTKSVQSAIDRIDDQVNDIIDSFGKTIRNNVGGLLRNLPKDATQKQVFDDVTAIEGQLIGSCAGYAATPEHLDTCLNAVIAIVTKRGSSTIRVNPGLLKGFKVISPAATGIERLQSYTQLFLKIKKIIKGQHAVPPNHFLTPIDIDLNSLPVDMDVFKKANRAAYVLNLYRQDPQSFSLMPEIHEDETQSMLLAASNVDIAGQTRYETTWTLYFAFKAAAVWKENEAQLPHLSASALSSKNTRGSSKETADLCPLDFQKIPPIPIQQKAPVIHNDFIQWWMSKLDAYNQGDLKVVMSLKYMIFRHIDYELLRKKSIMSRTEEFNKFEAWCFDRLSEELGQCRTVREAEHFMRQLQMSLGKVTFWEDSDRPSTFNVYRIDDSNEDLVDQWVDLGTIFTNPDHGRLLRAAVFVLSNGPTQPRSVDVQRHMATFDSTAFKEARMAAFYLSESYARDEICQLPSTSEYLCPLVGNLLKVELQHTPSRRILHWIIYFALRISTSGS